MTRKKPSAVACSLTAEDIARLNTWTVEIAAKHRGVVTEEANGDRRVGDSRALIVHPSGFWHNFTAAESGHDALSLLNHLHDGSEQAALEAAKDWLAQNGGDGLLARTSGNDEDKGDAEAVADDARRTAYVETLWRRAVAIEGGPAETYLKGRGLSPLPSEAAGQLRWLPNFRGDEGAMIAPIDDNYGKNVALQLTHITPEGQKSQVQPVRKTLRGPHDWRTRGAFRLGAPGAGALIICEGVEDALSAFLAGAGHVHACLGVSALGRADLPAVVEKVTVVRDDDPPGSPACLAHGRGVARLLGQGRKVSITLRAGQLAGGAKDINDLLQIDVELARRQLSEVGGLKLLDAAEREALLDEVSRAPADVYESSRRAIAGALNWRAKALDDDRRERRIERADGDDADANVTGVKPWPDPVTDFAVVLDAAVEQLKRFLIVPDPTYLDTIALWSAHTHLVHLEALRVGYTPRLGLQSPSRRCGKSTGLKAAYLLSHNARMAASITPSSLFRAVDAQSVSLFIDEADNVVKGMNPDLLAILNSGADLMTAKVMRSEALGDGRFESREFSTFAPVALTSIKQLPDTLQDRTISLPLKRATKGERPERLTLRTRDLLIDTGRQLARWAADLTELPDPDMPTDLFNRVEDRWFVLFQIAKAAGGDWPERCRKAALADLAREEANDAIGGRNADLLSDLWRVFHEQGVAQIYTDDICAALNSMEESPWRTANRGKELDGYYLREHLADFLPDDPEKIAPRRWRDGKANPKFGYHEQHFEDAFDRYLRRGLPSTEQKTGAGGGDSARAGIQNHPTHPAHPTLAARTDHRSELYSVPDTSDASDTAPPTSDPNPMPGDKAPNVPDVAPDGRHASDTQKIVKTPIFIGNVSDVLDGSDDSDPLRARTPVVPDLPSDDQKHGPIPDVNEWVVKPGVAPREQNGEGRPAVLFPRGAQPRRRREMAPRSAQ